MKRINLTWLAVMLALLLSACAPKPPGCADPQVADTAKGMLADRAAKGLEDEMKDDPDNLVRGFLDGTKVEFVQVLNEGYAADKRKQSCRANLRIVTPADRVLENQVKYTVQVTEDAKSQYVLELESGQMYVMALQSAAQKHYKDSRWAGNWRGSYACAGIDGATDGPKGPFTMPVTLVVTGIAGKLERTTRGGGTEKLQGQIVERFNTPAMLTGTGSNSPDDMWAVDFYPVVQGKRLTGDGQLWFKEEGVRRILRNCTLDLQQEPVVLPQAKGASSAR